MSLGTGGVAPHSLGAAVERLRTKWGAIVAFGTLLVLMGAASLVFAFASTLAVVTLNGILFLVGGAAEIGVGMHAKAWGRFFLWVLGGLLYLAAGVFCILNPLLAAGVVRAVLAFELPSSPQRPMLFLAALVTFLLGLIIVIHWPLSSAYALGTLLGVDLLVHGAGWVSFGIGLRKAK